jgi:hypothetical protein
MPDRPRLKQRKAIISENFLLATFSACGHPDPRNQVKNKPKILWLHRL